MSVPIFDSLAHPTLTGHWLRIKDVATFDHLAASLARNEFLGAAAIGIHELESFEASSFANCARKFPQLYPVAGYAPTEGETIEEELKLLMELGYRAIKVHPRFSRLDLTDFRLVETLRAAEKMDIIVFLCTYQFSALDQIPEYDPFLATIRLLKASPRTKVVLVHGGAIDLLRYAELARFNFNLILDLSLTLNKYEDSSIDRDILFLFRKFDQRICIGSDFPEYSHAAVRRRFESFAQGLPIEKVENIAFRNILNFIDRTI